MRPHTDPQRVEENPQQTHQSARKFLQTLENAAYAREENPQQATLVRELVNSLSSGELLLMPTDVVWNLDEDTQEEEAIAKLDALIELVISMRMRWNANRSLGTLEGDMTESEAWATAQELLSSMSTEERRAYAFCFQTNRSHQFFFALLRQPSFFNAEGLEKLLEEWTNIENSSEYKETIEERKRRTELQTQPKAELQNLRMERESAPTFDGPSQRNPDPGYPAQLSGRQEVATPPDALCLSQTPVPESQNASSASNAEQPVLGTVPGSCARDDVEQAVSPSSATATLPTETLKRIGAYLIDPGPWDQKAPALKWRTIAVFAALCPTTRQAVSCPLGSASNARLEDERQDKDLETQEKKDLAEAEAAAEAMYWSLRRAGWSSDDD